MKEYIQFLSTRTFYNFTFRISTQKNLMTVTSFFISNDQERRGQQEEHAGIKTET
jgi:hypothetical protein